MRPGSAIPAALPAVSARSAANGLSVSVSWNGATEVATWRVLAGPAPGALAPVAAAPDTGFQTTIAAASAGPYVQVQALDANGNVLGASAVVKG